MNLLIIKIRPNHMISFRFLLRIYQSESPTIIGLGFLIKFFLIVCSIRKFKPGNMNPRRRYKITSAQIVEIPNVKVKSISSNTCPSMSYLLSLTPRIRGEHCEFAACCCQAILQVFINLAST
jgi:hypothetical protein